MGTGPGAARKRERQEPRLRSDLAVGEWNFWSPRNRKIVAQATETAAAKFGVKVYRLSNSGNHLHLIVKLGNRFAYNGFIRSLTGTIALQITRTNKFKGLVKTFWSARPFSRIVEWGRAFNILKNYVILNQLEADGVVPYNRQRLKNFHLHEFVPDG